MRTRSARRLARCWCAGDAVPYPRHHHGPVVHAGGDQLAGVEPELAIVQIPLVLRGELAVEDDRQPHGFIHLRARIRKRRRGEDDADAKAGMSFECRTRLADHGGEQFAPGNVLQRGEDRKTGIAEAASEFERPDAAGVDDGVEIDIAAMTIVAQQILCLSILVD
jgi:hypothetical protein